MLGRKWPPPRVVPLPRKVVGTSLENASNPWSGRPASRCSFRGVDGAVSYYSRGCAHGQVAQVAARSADCATKLTFTYDKPYTDIFLFYLSLKPQTIWKKLYKNGRGARLCPRPRRVPLMLMTCVPWTLDADSKTRTTSPCLTGREGGGKRVIQ